MSLTPGPSNRQQARHDDVLTTFTSYGQADRLRQVDIILSMNTVSEPDASPDMIEQMWRLVSASPKTGSSTINQRRE